MLRDLFLLKGDKELSFGERKVLDTARNLLVKELSIARSHTEEKIMEELSHIFTSSSGDRGFVEKELKGVPSFSSFFFAGGLRASQRHHPGRRPGDENGRARDRRSCCRWPGGR